MTAMNEDRLTEIRDELRELRRLIESPPARADDLVDANYIATRTGLAERTVKEGKAGTDAIPRVELKSAGASRSLIRYPRGAADRFVAELARNATTPKQRAHEFMARLQKRKRKVM